MKTLLIGLLIISSAVALAQQQQQQQQVEKLPEVPPCSLTPALRDSLFSLLPDGGKEVVKKNGGMVVVDLGSGDGNMLHHALELGAKKVIGYEKDKKLLELSRNHLLEAFPSRSRDIELINGDFMEADVSSADLILFWGVTPIMAAMENKLMTPGAAKAGARILTVDAQFPFILRPSSVMETTWKGKEKACPAQAVYTGENVVLYSYRTPLKVDSYEHFREEHIGTKPVLEIRHLKHPDTLEPTGHINTWFRKPVCSEHKRFGCVTAAAISADNTLKHIMIDLENYKELVGHKFKVTKLKHSDDPEEKTLIGTVLSKDQITQHQGLWYYTFALPAPGIPVPEGDEPLRLEFDLSHSFRPHLHLSFNYQMQGTDWIGDGAWDLVPSPRSLGVYFIAQFNRQDVGFWVRRHQKTSQVHLEMRRNGQPVYGALADAKHTYGTDIAAHTLGWSQVFNQLSRHRNEILGFRATFIEEPRPFMYAYEDVNFTRISERLAEHHETQKNVSSPIPVAHVDVVPGLREVVHTHDSSAELPDMTLRIFSRSHATSKIGISLLYDPTEIQSAHMEDSIMIVLYTKQYTDGHLFAWECVPAARSRDDIVGGPDGLAEGVREMCTFNHALPPRFYYDELEFDVWFSMKPQTETTLRDRAKLVTKEKIEAMSGHKTALFRWMQRSGVTVNKLSEMFFEPNKLGVKASEKIAHAETLLSVPQHTIVRPQCQLCKGDWQQQLLDSISSSKPVIFFALEYAKIALYTLHPSKAPFNTDEFAYLIEHFDKIRELRDFHDDVLPFQRQTSQPADIDQQMKEGKISYDDAAISILAWEQRQALIEVYEKVSSYVQKLPQPNGQQGGEIDGPENGAWLKDIFPDSKAFLDYVAVTARAIFPEFTLVPLFPLFKTSPTPNAQFRPNSVNISIEAIKDISAGEQITVGCNSYEHLVRLFEGKDINTRLTKVDSGRGRCVRSVLLRESGVVLWRDFGSLNNLEQYYGQNVEGANNALQEALRYTKDKEQKEIIQWGLEHVFKARNR